MIIQIVGEGENLSSLKSLVEKALSELSLTDAVKVQETNDPSYKMELGVTENPALCIEEESIDFKDMIFQGEIPEYDEIKSMFLSILGDEEDHEGGWCGSCSTGWCGTCGEEEWEDESCSTGCH
jgi:hypothetical protein